MKLLEILNLKTIAYTENDNGLTVGGWLYLRGTQISSLPDNLTVGDSLCLEGTQISSLPDNLTVGGWLYLRGTQISSLPDNLTVGGSLCLRGTQISSLPDNLTVGDSLCLEGTQYPHFTEGCGHSNRTIYAVYNQGNYCIVAGCFFDTLDKFCEAVDRDYRLTVEGEEYKQQAIDLVERLKVEQ